MAKLTSELWLRLSVLLFASTLQVVSCMQLFNTSLVDLSPSCAKAASADVSCSQLYSAQYVGQQGYIGGDALSEMCSGTCASSLRGFQDAVDKECGDKVYSFPGNVNQTVPSIVHPIVWAYSVACLKSGSSFCLPEVLSGDASPCSDCMLKYEAEMLDSAYGQFRYSPDSFRSTLSSCAVPTSRYPFTQPPSTPTGTQTASSAPQPPCSSTYVVGSGDTCESIASSHSVALARFITDNSLNTVNCTVQQGQLVCIGQKCALYKVENGDTCDSILQGKTFYLAQLRSWNPTLWPNCGNLGSMVGQDICVSPPGTTSWNVPASANISATWNVTFIAPPTAFATLLPQPSTFPIWNLSTISWPVTIMSPPVHSFTLNETEVDRYEQLIQYCPITPEDISNGWTIFNLPDNCEDMLEQYCNPPANAPIPAPTTFPATCSPAYYLSSASVTGTSSAVGPVQTGISSNCDSYYMVKKGDSCYSIQKHFGNFTLSEFYSWNPAIGSNCHGLEYGYDVCVGVASPSTTGTSSSSATTTTSTIPSNLMPSTDLSCTKYYTVQSGDSCGAIAAKFGISFAQFSSWNPKVGSTCTSLWLGYAVCVAAPSTTSQGSPSSTQSSTTALSVEPSTDPKCTKYHKVVSGDSCWSIEQKYGISASEFNKWNPYVGSNCHSLWVGYDVCVGAPGASTPPSSKPSPIQPGTISDCSKYYRIASGDGCYKIEQQNGVTLSQIVKWNPEVGKECTDLWVGYYICVAGP